MRGQASVSGLSSKPDNPEEAFAATLGEDGAPKPDV
jgi:hypothetical protein